MSKENVEVVRLVYEGFNESGMPDFRLLDPEIEWHTSDRALERGTYRGHAGVKAFLSSGHDVWTDAKVEPEGVHRRRRARRRSYYAANAWTDKRHPIRGAFLSGLEAPGAPDS
jgi:hypothetical protein